MAGTVVLFGRGDELWDEWRTTPMPEDRNLCGVWADWLEDNWDELGNPVAAGRLLTYLRNRFNNI